MNPSDFAASQLGYHSQRRRAAHRGQNAILTSLASDSIFPSQHVLFRARFRQEEGSDLVAICDEGGNVTINQATERERGGQRAHWKAHNNAIFDIAWPKGGSVNHILTASADQTVALWDWERAGALGEPILRFCGHTFSIRTISPAPNTQHLFVTGSNDGSVLVWDTRNRGKCTRAHGTEMNGRGPVQRVSAAHRSPLSPIKATSSTNSASKGRRKSSTPHCDTCTTPHITSVKYANEYSILSASANASQGVRLWDVRMMGVRGGRDPSPAFVYHPTTSGMRKQRGITSLAMDRYGSRFYAAVTGGIICEFSLSAPKKRPIREFRGASILTFFVDMASSPNGDYLLAGSSDGQPTIWDTRPHLNEDMSHQYPLLRLAGHEGEVAGVAWGNRDIIVTCEDHYYRYWSSPIPPAPRIPIGPAGMVASAVPFVPTQASTVSAHSLPALSSLNILGSRAASPRKVPSTSALPHHRTPTKIRATAAAHTPTRERNVASGRGSPCSSNNLNKTPSSGRKRRRPVHSPSPDKENACMQNEAFSQLHVNKHLRPCSALDSPFQAATPTVNLPNIIEDPESHCHGSGNKTPRIDLCERGKKDSKRPLTSQNVISYSPNSSLSYNPTTPSRKPTAKRPRLSIPDFFKPVGGGN